MNRARVILLAGAVAVATVTIWVLGPCVANGFLDWDDFVYLRNVAMRHGLSGELVRWAFTHARPFYYHPLTWLAHAADYQVWGAAPAGHHATSLALHALVAAMVVVFAWQLLSATGRVSDGERLALAIGVGLVFGIHPLQVETVAWVAERKTILCTLFCMASLCAYIRAVGGTATNRRWWWAMVVLYAAALLAKPMAVPLPVVMLALDFFPLRRIPRQPLSGLLREKTLLFALAGTVGVVTMIAQRHEGAVTSFGQFGAAQRVVVAGRNILFGIWKLAWPEKLSPYYPLEGNVRISDPEFLGGTIVVVIATAVIWRLRTRAPALAATWLAFLALFLPTSGLLQVGSQGAANRFMYLAMVPLLLAAGAGAVWLWRRMPRLGRPVLLALAGCQLLFLGFRARGEVFVWHDDEKLWTAAREYFPDSALVNWQLAVALATQERFAEALPLAQTAARLSPEFDRAHTTLGLILLKTGRTAEAVAELRQPRPGAVSYDAACFGLACAYAKLGRNAEAWEVLRGLLARAPEYAALSANDAALARLRAAMEVTHAR